MKFPADAEPVEVWRGVWEETLLASENVAAICHGLEREKMEKAGIRIQRDVIADRALCKEVQTTFTMQLLRVR